MAHGTMGSLDMKSLLALVPSDWKMRLFVV